MKSPRFPLRCTALIFNSKEKLNVVVRCKFAQFWVGHLVMCVLVSGCLPHEPGAVGSFQKHPQTKLFLRA